MSCSLRIEEIIASCWSGEKKMAWFEGEWWTAERMFKLVDENVKRLKEAGFSAGDRIATLLPTSPAFLSICMAAWKLRGSVAALNPMAGAQGIAALIKHSMPAVIAAAPALKPHAAALSQLPMPTVFVEDKEPLPADFKAFSNIKSKEDMAMLFYTSGTTGTPKGAPLTHWNIISDVRHALAQVFPDISEQTLLNILPNFHTLGGSLSSIMPLIVGIPQVIRASLMPVGDTIRAIEEGQASFLVTVPTLLHFLSGAAAKTGWKPSSVKYAICGGDKLSNALRDRVEKTLGIKVVEGYGLTECSPILAAQLETGTPDGSAGRLLCDIDYKLCDLEGNPVDGDEGVLWIKGPNVATEYFNSPEITAMRFKDGWFNTGDMVRVDRNRFVYIQERVSDLIIVGGFNVYPQEVEAVLNQNPKVKESAVVGVKRSVTGQMIRGYVILKEGMTATSAELVEWCRERLPHYKVPRHVSFATDFPRNMLGKVLRRELRVQAEKGTDE